MRTHIVLLIALLLLPAAFAELQLDDIQFDPAIIASGDTVDIIVQFHQDGLASTDPRIGNPDYRFGVTLEPDDTLTRNHILFMDAQGDDLQGIITRGGTYSKRFRVKVLDDAPAGTYEFKLVGQWYQDDVAQSGTQYLKFTMPVKREGIQLAIANVQSDPRRVRSGDKDVLLHATIVNSGEKTAKDIRVRLTHPDGITSSYADGNDRHLGTIGPGEETQVEFSIDTDRGLPEGTYQIGYVLTYEDTDGNAYDRIASFPIVVKKRPDIVITDVTGEGRAGSEVELRVTLKNVGEETADTVDARILKSASQPLSMDVRSDYVGALAPGEEGMAVFRIGIDRDAEIKEHRLTVLVRATGDAEEGDTNVYTFTDVAPLRVTGPATNRWPLIAGVFVVLVVIGAIAANRIGKRNARKR